MILEKERHVLASNVVINHLIDSLKSMELDSSQNHDQENREITEKIYKLFYNISLGQIKFRASDLSFDQMGELAHDAASSSIMILLSDYRDKVDTWFHLVKGRADREINKFFYLNKYSIHAGIYNYEDDIDTLIDYEGNDNNLENVTRQNYKPINAILFNEHLEQVNLKIKEILNLFSVVTSKRNIFNLILIKSIKYDTDKLIDLLPNLVKSHARSALYFIRVMCKKNLNQQMIESNFN